MTLCGESVKKLNKTIMSVLMFSLLSTGCQQVNQQRMKYVRDREKDYLASTVMAPLRVPEDLSYLKGQEHYSFPDVIPGRVDAVSIVPPGFGELSQS
ncbi:hypothetical protein [Candidatus Berkiella aquae]|uniref:Uncharacterized protein n=1 Tax=Candidatus Berkiella aquae TaxID=295108 RepID=A0A0Q9YZC2_9GAMM|nr:hypothetical protein [Candidatus Berkiella aquae]MCS5712465.1 hypothetical protein [Candidatus Berkiella aquae]